MKLGKPLFDHDFIRQHELTIEDMKAEGAFDPSKMACGCGIKLDLETHVYPALKETIPDLKEMGFKFFPRDDAYLFRTDGGIKFRRGCYKIKDILHDSRVFEDVEDFEPNAAISVVSISRGPYPKIRFKNALMNFYTNAAKASCRFMVGKGHSIFASLNEEQEFMLQDYLKHEDEGKYYGAANNDTIQLLDRTLRITADPQVFAAINNSLNDLFLFGITDNITIYPSFDSYNEVYQEDLANSFRRYAKMTGFKVAELEPLNVGTQVIGATVTGTTTVVPPVNSSANVGDEVILTRPVGDLVVLNAYLAKKLLSREDEDKKLAEVRHHILNLLGTPNYELAKVVKEFRPRIGNDFDSESHISSSRDVTGQGIFSLQELAQDSNVLIELNELPLHDEEILRFQEIAKMGNATSGTNGATIITASPSVMPDVKERLIRGGYNPITIGKVLAKGEGKVVAATKIRKLLQVLVPKHPGLFES